jgi:hypothetical protein
MNDKQKPAWVDRATSLLDESARDLDAATLSRLNRARQTALELARPRRAHSWMLPAVASACAVLLAVAIWMPQRGTDNARPSPSAIGPGATDANGDEVSLDFYQDLEFYAWLDAQAKNDKDGDNG